MSSLFCLWDESRTEEWRIAYQQCELSLEREWEDECAKYEAFEPVPVGIREAQQSPRQEPEHAQQRPRRNYANPESVVLDPTLYPYHESLYPLLDAYDSLYDNGNDGYASAAVTTTTSRAKEQPIESNAVPPCFQTLKHRVYFNNYSGEPNNDHIDTINNNNNNSRHVVEDEEDDDEDEDQYSSTPVSVQSLVRTLVDDDLLPLMDYKCSEVLDLMRIVIATEGQALDSFDVDMQLLASSSSFVNNNNMNMTGSGGSQENHQGGGGCGCGDTGNENSMGGGEADAATAAAHAAAIRQFWARRALQPIPALQERVMRTKQQQQRRMDSQMKQRVQQLRAMQQHSPFGFSKTLPLMDGLTRCDVLLRLLRHTLSDLQRDYRLASAIAVSLMRFRDLDDVSVLVRYLTVVSLEYSSFVGASDNDDDDDGTESDDDDDDDDDTASNRNNHYQQRQRTRRKSTRYERKFFREAFTHSLAIGITAVTQQHAMVLASFCWHTFHREIGHLMLDNKNSASYTFNNNNFAHVQPCSTNRVLNDAAAAGPTTSSSVTHSTARTPTKSVSPTTFQERQKLLVKRKAFIRLTEEDKDIVFTNSKKVPVALISCLLLALWTRGVLEKTRLDKILSTMEEDGTAATANNDDGNDIMNHRTRERVNGIHDSVFLAQSLESYQNCARALVDIGEAIIKYLPNSDRFYKLASVVVAALCGLYADSDNLSNLLPWDRTCQRVVDDDDDDDQSTDDHNDSDVASIDIHDLRSDADDESEDIDDDEEEEEEDIDPPVYLGRQDPRLRKRRLYIENRFALTVSKATEYARAGSTERTVGGHNNQQLIGQPLQRISSIVFGGILQCLKGRPPECVREVVRTLFVQDKVDLSESMCGYSDFCLWCRFDIHPLDPAMFWHDTSYPDEVEESDSDDEDDSEVTRGDEASINWDVDEDGHALNRGQHRAHLDYSLLLLMREWQKPWTPERHMSFQPEFRQAVHTVFLCGHRLCVPPEVTKRMVECMHREWWPDARRQCWNYDCQVQSTQNYYDEDRKDRPAYHLSTLLTNNYDRCPHCRVATYCSEECRLNDWKHFHKRYCNVPPCRIPGRDEESFIASLSMNQEAHPSAAAESIALELDQARISEPAVGAPAVGGDESSASVVEDDNDTDWEDVESDDDDVDAAAFDDSLGSNDRLNKSRKIYAYFSDRSYNR